MSKPTALITGVGVGTGAALARRFARGGYQVAMLARSRERLVSLEQEIPDSKAYVCDIANLDGLITTVDMIGKDMGEPSVLIHNAVSATFNTFLEADPEDLEKNFRVNTTSLLYLARALAPKMIDVGHGTIIVTGNTAALRGIPETAVFAPTKAGQRILAQSLARDLGPKGIHVAYVTIDAAIDTPWTRIPFHPDKSDEFFSKPSAIADEVFHVAHQDRSAWSFDVIIRPDVEKW